jgi:hypothetical protein
MQESRWARSSLRSRAPPGTRLSSVDRLERRPVPALTRVLERLDALYALGDKIGYSAQEDEAHRLARAWMEDAGLAVEVDDAGNLIGRSGRSDDVWTGSHLDSVPHGGRFDGMLGVVDALVAAAELILRIRDIAARIDGAVATVGWSRSTHALPTGGVSRS